MKVKRLLLLAVFITLALAQLAAPVTMIARRETVLRHGRRFLFRVKPVDPYDAFRGRYVAISFGRLEAPNPEGLAIRGGQKVFATIEEERGFAVAKNITTERPIGHDYLQIRVLWTNRDTVHCRLPFDRYYLEEDTAPLVDKALRSNRAGAGKEAWAAVRVKDGLGVLEKLYIGGEPLEVFLREHGR